MITAEMAQLCDSMRIMLVESTYLPPLEASGAQQLYQTYEDTHRPELDRVMNRLIESTIRAVKSAPDAPALQQMSKEFYSLHDEIQEFITQIEPGV